MSEHNEGLKSYGSVLGQVLLKKSLFTFSMCLAQKTIYHLPCYCLDLAQHFLVKNGITAIRRIRKTDNNRIARACGATIVNRTEELKEEDIGTGAGLFEIKKFGDE